MSLWRRGPSEPGLTIAARKLSAALMQLDDAGKAKTAETIRAIVTGIRNLGGMPEAVTEILWDILVTVARKAIMGGDVEKIMAEIEAGIDPSVRSQILGEANR